MKPRDPLTERVVHELREIDPDPEAWIEGPYRGAPHIPRMPTTGLPLALLLGVVAWALLGLLAFFLWW